jgi:hypothetical protein
VAGCTLCGEPFGQGRKRSKEHVFPEWLEKLFVPEDEQHLIQYHRRFQARGEPMQREEWEDIPFNLRVTLCEPCNNEWCNGIETEARPFLMPLIADQAISLDASAQTTLAIWATKTLLMLQRTHKRKERSMDDNAYRWFRTHRWPLPNEQIWIGRYNGSGDWPTSYRHFGMLIRKKPTVPQPPDGINAHCAAFGIGHLVFLAFGHTHESRPSARVKPGTPAAAAMRPIWPAFGGAVDFPPSGIVDGNSGLDAMIEAFGDAEAFFEGRPQDGELENRTYAVVDHI